jgi:hypothetical protein
MKKHLLYLSPFAILLFFHSNLFAQTRYWVPNGTGNWSSTSNWSTASNGSAGASVPSSSNDVVFDDKSFKNGSNTVNVDIASTCNNMTWVGVKQTPAFNINNPLTVAGTTFTLDDAMTVSGTGALTFSNTGSLSLNLSNTAKTLPDLSFTATTARTITINSSTNSAVQQTMGGITIGNNSTFTVTGASAKVYGAFTAGSDVLTTLAGNAFFSGPVTTGTNNQFIANGANNEFGYVYINSVTNSARNINFNNTNKFRENVYVYGPTDITDRVIFNASTFKKRLEMLATDPRAKFTNSCTFEGVVDISGGGSARFMRNDVFQADVAFGNDVFCEFTQDNTSGYTTTFNGNVTFGTDVRYKSWRNATFNGSVTFGANDTQSGTDDGQRTWGASAGTTTFNGPVSFGNSAGLLAYPVLFGGKAVFNNSLTFGTKDNVTFATGYNSSFTNVYVSGGSTIRFSAGATASISGSFDLPGCNGAITYLQSSSAGSQASLSFGILPAWNEVEMRDLKRTSGSTVTVAGVDKGNNTGFAFTALGRTLYWVNNSGNWNSNTNWSLTSGGGTYACPPTIYDEVIFDNNSFTGAGQIVTINTTTAACKNMTWSHTDTDNPAMAMTNALQIDGSLALSAAAMAITGSSAINFTSATAGKTITLNSKTIPTVNFNASTPATGGWILQDALSVTNAITLQAGTLNTNDKNVSGFSLSAAYTNLYRVLTLGNSQVSLTGSGNGSILDFGGPAFILTTPGATASISFTATTNYVGIQTGKVAIELPNLIYYGADVDITTYDYNGAGPTPTITFRNITLMRVATSGSRNQLFIAGNCPKAFGVLTIPDWTYNTVSSNGNTLNSSISTPSASGITTLGTFNNSTFNGTVTLGANCLFPFNGNNTFNAPVNIGASSAITFSGNNTFNGLVTTGALSNVAFTSSHTNAYTNISPGLGATWSFSAGGTSTVSGLFSSGIACSGAGAVVNSSSVGIQANVILAQSQIWNSISLTDLNNTGATSLSIAGGLDGGNNTNVSFNPRTVYWVNGSGPWNSVSGANWSNSSGGPSGACPPSIYENVVFDNNSFPSNSQTVSVGTGAVCRNLTWSVLDDNAHILALATNNLTINGSLQLNNSMTLSASATTAALAFTSAQSGQTITTAGRTIPAMLFNSLVPAVGGWTLQDALTVTNQIGLQAGNLATNDLAISCRSLDANDPIVAGTDPARSLALGNSVVTISGSNSNGGYTVLDLAGSFLTFVTPGASARFIFTGAGTSGDYLSAYFGGKAKTLPDLDFGTAATAATSPTDIDLLTGSGTERITFRNITVYRTAGADFYINGTAPKTYGNITISTLNYNSGQSKYFEGTSNASPNNNIFSGTITIGASSDLKFYGNNTFQQNVTFGTGSTLLFDNSNTFQANMTAGAQTVTTFRRSVSFTSGGSQLLDLGSRSVTYIGDPPPIDVVNFSNNFNNIVVGTQGRVYFNNGTGSNVIKDLTLNSFTLTKFNHTGTNTITGTLTANALCSTWIALESIQPSLQAPITFNTAQTIAMVSVQDINVTSTNLTNNTGVDRGNNTGITYGSSVRVAAPTLYWVGGTTGNTGDVNWSNAKNWALASGVVGASNSNTCIPSLIDDVVFDANSFTNSTRRTIEIDIANIQCKDLTFTGIPTGVVFDPVTINTNSLMEITGNLTFHSNLTNQYEGTIHFASTTATNTITTVGKPFLGPLDFAGNGTSQWNLADNLDVNGGTRGNITISVGTLSTGNNNINLEGNWRVRDLGAFSAGLGTNTVTFDGTSDQDIRALSNLAANSYFRNLTISKATGIAYVQQAGITVTNNLTLTAGSLDDRGFQIIGNGTGLVTMANATTLWLGDTNPANGASVFPTNFPAANISLNNGSTVRYNDMANQLVSSAPEYGNLIIDNTLYDATYGVKAKTIAGVSGDDLGIKGNLTVVSNTNFMDGGFQIAFRSTGASTRSIILQTASVLSLGNATAATIFPTSYTALSLNSASTVVYNAGNGISQPVQGFGATGNYGHLTITNASASPSVTSTLKKLNSATTVLGNLTIGAFNTFSDEGYQITGNSTNTFSIGANAQFSIGTSSSATTFPSSFNLTNVDIASTVVYNAGNSLTQTVKGLAGSGNSNYGNLVISNSSALPSLSGANKILNGLTTIRGNFTINGYNNFQDGGYQITGTNAGAFSLQPNSRLTIGTALPSSPAIANTQFPISFASFDLGAMSTPATASEVIYNAPNGYSQIVLGLSGAGNASYANLTITNSSGTPSITNTVKTLSGATTVRSNLTVNTTTQLADGGYQLTGSTIGSMSLASNAVLTLGDYNPNNGSTTFPTNFPAASVTLNNTSTVQYMDVATGQLVAGSLTYGNLSLINNSPVSIGPATLIKKNLTEAVQVNRLISVGSYIDWDDKGFQITGSTNTGAGLDVGANSQLTLGTNTTATNFPLNFNANAINLHSSSTVVYNAGINQNIQGLFDYGSKSSNLNYGHLTLTNSTTTLITKTLSGEIRVRGNLTINGYNTLDVSSSHRSINLQGNWLSGANSRFNAQFGLVTLEGSANQTITTQSSQPFSAELNTQDFNSLTINNSIPAPGAAVTLNSTAGVAGTLTFLSGIVSTTNTNLLILRNAALTTGASNTSHVAGPVRKVGNQAFIFPVGDGIYVRPIQISASIAASTAFTGSYFRTNPQPTYNGNSRDASLFNISAKEYWILNRDQNAGSGQSAVSVVLSWNGSVSNVGSGSQLTSLRVSRWDGSKWRDHDGINHSGDQTAGTVSSGNLIDSFSPFTLGSTDNLNPLPVTLLSFNAKRIGTQVELNWVTQQEQQNNHFIIERSGTDFKFETIGQVEGHGTTKERMAYQFVDPQPLMGMSYYRLKQVDINGQVEYSKRIAVAFEAEWKADLRPNPVGESEISVLRITSDKSMTALLEVVDLQGKVLLRQTRSLSRGVNEFEISNQVFMPTGVYLIRLTPTEKSEEYKAYQFKLVVVH